MALTNEQYQSLMRIYDERQLARARELQHRKDLIRSRVPEYSSIDEEIHSLAIREVYDRIGGKDPSPELTAKLDALSHKKDDLLIKAGFAADYLNVPYECNDCHDTGFVGSERCHCYKQLSLDILYNDHSNNYINITFEDFSIDPDFYPRDYIDEKTGLNAYDNAKKVLSSAKAFADSFDDDFRNILIYGMPGVGKTHLSKAIASTLQEMGHTVLYLTAFDLFSRMKKEKFSRDGNVDPDYKSLFSSDFLILDDLGTEFSTSMTSSFLFELINERIRGMRSTLISTNLDLRQLSDMYTERVISRIMQSYTILHLYGNDIRVLKKLQND